MNASQSSGVNVAQILRILAFFVVVLVAGWLLYLIRSTLLPFAIAFALSYVLVPLVDYIESYRINRNLGVAAVLIAIFGTFTTLSILVMPILVNGMESMMTGFVGQGGQWPVVMVNRGGETLRIDQLVLDEEHPDFTFSDIALPLELAPGGRDTLTVNFKPSISDPQQATLGLIGYVGKTKVGPIALHLMANSQEADQAVSLEPTFRVVASGGAIVDLSGVIYRFGRYPPGYIDQVNTRIAELQPQLEAAFPSLKGVDMAKYARDKSQALATDFLKDTPQLIGSLISGITFVVIVPLVLFFFLSEGRAIKRAIIELIPNQYFEMVLNLLYRIDLQLGGYIRGMVMSVLLISMFSVTGLWIIGLDNFLVVGVIAGVSNVIPYLGPLIGIITGTVAAAIQHSALDMSTILPVIIVFLVVQVLDNVFVAPVVVARSVNLHPLIVIFVVLVGSQLFGAAGMVLAVPATAVIKVSVKTIYEGLRSYSV